MPLTDQESATPLALFRVYSPPPSHPPSHPRHTPHTAKPQSQQQRRKRKDRAVGARQLARREARGHSRARRARTPRTPHAAPVASRSARARAPARVARAPRRPAGGAKERRACGATDRTGEEQEKKRPPRRVRTALLDCGGENHPRRRTRAARAARLSPVAPRALAPRGTAAVEMARDEDEDDDRRPDGRRAREEDDRGAREWPCSTAAARTTHGARRARVPRRDASTPLACSARSGDRRNDARQGHRPACEFLQCTVLG